MAVRHLPVRLERQYRAAGAERYTYDAAGRLQTATIAGGTRAQSYRYDGFGNLNEIKTDGVVQSIPVRRATNRLPNAADNPSYYATYDAAANQTGENGSPARSFDAFNSMLVGSNGDHYVYDAADERIAVTNLQLTQWRFTVRDTAGRVLRELSESYPSGGTPPWTWRKDYVYRGSALLGAYVSEDGAEKRIHYHLDHLGTPRLITEATTGTARARLQVTDFPFGEEAPFNIGNTEKRHFTGHERDYNSGTTVANSDYLDYMHARYYSPRMGRFLSPDPLDGLQRLPQSWNRYAYALNKPLKFTDPTGMYEFAPCTGSQGACQADQAAFEQARQANLQSQDTAVQAAAAAYGDPGQKNGVTVGFGNLTPGTAGEATPMLQGMADGTVGMTATVMFQTGLSGTNLRAAVGHEGQHVLDAQGFIASFAKNPLMEGGVSWDITKNLTVRQTETNAYRITHSIFRNAAQTFNGGCQGCNLGTAAKTPADVNLAINRILTNPGGPYAAKLNNRQHTGWVTPPTPKP